MSAKSIAIQLKDGAERFLSIGVLALMSALPIAEILGRQLLHRGERGPGRSAVHLPPSRVQCITGTWG
jgi:hypothetical protein